MKWQLSPEFLHLLKKKVDVRVRNGFWDALEKFEKNPNDPSLDHKQLSRNLAGLWKIDITEDDKNAAIYEKIQEGDEEIAYFIQIGDKKTLYNEKNTL
jgi:hypothetical protein